MEINIYRGQDLSHSAKDIHHKVGDGSLPSECVKLKDGERSYVYSADWQVYLVIGCLLCIYTASALTFFRARNKMSFMTRSPLTAALSQLFLGTDTITNTLIFSGIKLGDMYHW